MLKCGDWRKGDGTETMPPKYVRVIGVCAGVVFAVRFTDAGWRIDGQDEYEADVKQWTPMPVCPFPR